MIYLDNCATTKPRSEVTDEILNSLNSDFSNPSSIHSFGHKVEKKIESSRRIISEFIHVNPEEVYFTSGGTESNNIFIRGAVERNRNVGNKIITTKIEHPSVGEVFKYLKVQGFEVIYLSSDGFGKVDIDDLKKNMDEKVALVSIMHVNNELGTINDINSCSEIIKSINPRTLFHVDGVQAFGKIPLDLKMLKVDGYSMSGHKIHGPKGIGALYIRKNISLPSLIHGGGQEKGIRSGTENTSGILGFGKAVEILKDRFQEEENHKSKMRELIVQLIEEKFTDYVINTPLNESPSAIINISFLKTKGEVIVHHLEQHDIYISTTSACSSNAKSESVLEKLGKSQDICDGSIRICLSYDINEEDIVRFVDELYLAVEDIRKITMR